jgi:hypothetical protein
MILIPFLDTFQPEIQSVIRIFMLTIILCMVLTQEQIDLWKTFIKNKLSIFYSDNRRYDDDFNTDTSSTDIEDTEEEDVEDTEEKDNEDVVDTSEGKIITKHLRVLSDIEDTKFETKIFHLTFNYRCENKHIKIEPCFCKICGNYVCFNTEDVPKKSICTHYTLFDCIHPGLDDLSGHIHIRDKEKVIKTVESLLQSKDDTETQEFYKAKLGDFVYDDTRSGVVVDH